MNPFSRISGYFRALFRKNRLDSDMDEEMRLHIEMKMQANLRAGMNPDEARSAALKQFGWQESIKETCREQRGVGWIEDLVQDLRFGGRMLRKSPGFTVVAVLTLALGIGATTTIFSVVKTTLFDPLPVRHSSDRYLQLVSVNKEQGWASRGINAPALRDVLQQTNLFNRVAAYEVESLSFQGEEFPEPVIGARVTPEFFRFWALRPSKGRVFTDDEAEAGRDDVLVISHQFWQKRLGGDPNIVGRVLRFRERPMTVVGVTPPFFAFPMSGYEYWRPFCEPKPAQSNGSIPPGSAEWNSDTGVIVEMRDGISRAQVQAFLNVVSKRQAQEAPFPNSFFKIQCRDVNELFSKPELSQTLWILLGAIAFVLLIACANIANLQLARTERRRSELAVRSALGAGKARVFRQLLTENSLLAGLGGLASIGVIFVGLQLLQKLISPELPRLKPITLDPGVLCIALGATLISAVLFGLMPSKAGVQGRLNEVLKLGAATGSRDHKSGRFSSGLIICQVAVACVLLASAGLMVRSVIRLLTVNPGFDPQNVVQIYPQLEWNRFTQDQEQGIEAAFADMHARVSAIPGVIAAGVESQGWDVQASIMPGGPTLSLEERFVGTGQADPLRALRVFLLAGRWLERGDLQASPPRVLLNQTAARRLWPAGSAVGKQVWFRKKTGSHSFEDIACEIVGVIGDLREDRYDQTPKPAIFRPRGGVGVNARPPYLVARTSSHPVKLYGAIGRELKAAGAGMWQPHFVNLQETLYAATAGQRTLMLYLLVFASVGVFLAAIGLYGVLAYSVARRTREIGIRMALGAERREVLAMIMSQGMRLVLAGLVIGLVSALALSRTLRAFLFGITNHDTLTLVSVAVLFSIIAGLASFLPARRAAKVNPMEALRYE
jgi:predicted permease